MFGQALWNWVRSARKRPYLDYSFEHLLEEASKLKPNDQNKAASIRSELGYRKLLKLEKKKLILDLLSKTNTNDVSKLEYEDEEEVTEPGAPHAQEETEAEESVEEEEPIELVDRDQEVSQALSVKTINTLYRNGIKDINQLEMMNDEDILSLKGIGQQALGQIRSVFPYSPNQTLSQPLRTESFATVPELTEENFIKSSALEVDPSFDLTDILPFASYPEIADYFSNHLNQNQIHALLSEVAKPRLEYFLRRCSGETLQNIADSQGITREGVRQHSAKIEKKTGIKPQDVVNYFNQAYSDANDRDILLAFEKDLSQTSAIGENVNDVWRNIHKREPTLADRINLFEKYCVPISLSELNIHIDLIEKSVGSYGGETYWKESTLRFLIWCMSIRLGKTGIMPKQVEMPSLLSRYIQKDFGGQRRAAEIFGLEYTGPVGSRNRSYWTEDRITDAVLNTQKYFCIPAELMPEQSHLNYYLDIDNDDDTKGPSCVAAIKRLGSWEDGAKKIGLQIFAELTPEQKTAMEKQIAINFWNRNIPFSSKSAFLDSANMFVNTFWRAPSEPNKYSGIMSQMRSISRLISEKKIQLNETLTMQSLLSAPPLNDGEDDSSNNQAIDEIMDILF